MDGQPQIQQKTAREDQYLVDSPAIPLPGAGSPHRLRYLRERLGSASSLEQLYEIASQQLMSDADWLSVAHIQLLDGSDSTSARVQTFHSVEHLQQEELTRMTEVCLQAAARGTAQVTGLATRPGAAIIAVPLEMADSRSALAAAVTLHHASAEYVEYLELLASRIELQTLKVKDAIHTRQLGLASGLLGAVRRVQAAADVAAALELACRSCSELFNARAALSFNPDPTVSSDLIESCSDEHKAISRTLVLDAANESLAHGEVISWSRSERELPAGVRSLQQLGEELQLDSVIAASWKDPGNRGADLQARGTLIIAGATDDIVSRRQVHAAVSAFLPAIHAVSVQKRGLLALARAAGQRALHSSRYQILGIVLVAAFGALLIRRPYQIKCDCTLEPVVRRFVSAPVDAPLAETLVRPGDVVEENQLLAELNGRDLRWELAGIEADLEQAWKERDSHLAAQRFAEAESSRLEATQLELRRQLISQHLSELQVRSPFAGMIIDGDLDKARGIRLTTGEQLFEIAPLDEMIVEIAIPESDISYVDVGTVLEVRLNAYSDQTWEGVLERVHPRSEVRDGANVFIGEVRFQNEGGRLKPGMEGRVTIQGPVRSIGWSLFHRAAEESLLWLGW